MEPDELFGLPLDRFVPERVALARTLRAEGRRDEAAKVAQLRKPSVAAWAVNQIVRTQQRSLAELFGAGDALREAHERVIAGRAEARALSAATRNEREAVDTLVEAARGLLSSEGQELSAATVDHVADTLHAAALDDEARERVRHGCLQRELHHVGLGLAGQADAVPAKRQTRRQPAARKRAGGGAAPRKDAGQAPAPRKDARQSPVPRKDARQAPVPRKDARAAAAARREARVAAAEAGRRAERSARAVAVAEERRERALTALREADDALATARAEAEAADDAHRDAEKKLSSL